MRASRKLVITAAIAALAAGPVSASASATPARSAASGSAASTRLSPWYQSGWNQSGTGYNPFESSLTSANVSGLHSTWIVATPGTGGLDLSGVDSVNGVAFFEDGGDNSLHAVDIATGLTRWQVTVPACVNATSPPAIHLGVVVVSSQPCVSGRGYLTGYDLLSGRRLWQWRPGLNLSPPITANGFVYDESTNLGFTKLHLDAIDVKTGKLQWQITRPAPLSHNDVTLAADSRHIYLSSPTYVQALAPATGAIDWARPVPGGLHLMVSAGHVIVGGIGPAGTVLTAYSTHGVRLWQRRLLFNEVAATPNQVILTDFTGVVQALALTNGHPIWQRTMAGADLGISQPAIAGGVVYLPGLTSTGPAVFGLGIDTGAELWSEVFAAGDTTRVSVAAGALLVSINGAVVTALQP